MLSLEQRWYTKKGGAIHCNAKVFRFGLGSHLPQGIAEKFYGFNLRTYGFRMFPHFWTLKLYLKKVTLPKGSKRGT